ncbi:MAG: DUF58 domain-containing protein [Microcella sp.]
MPRPTLRGVIFALVGVAIVTLAYLIERPELLAVGVVAVAAPLIALVVVATGRPRVRVSRHLDPVVATVGEPVTVTVTVAGRSRAAEWVERVPMRPGFAGPGRLPDVRRTRPARFSYRYWPAERGLVAVGPLLIEERDPVALAVRVTDTMAEATQLVVPQLVPLAPGPVPEPSTEAGPRSSRSRERADDDVITREYRNGDALRRVHWRVTARHGELMVRQDEPQAGPHSRLIVDTDPAGYLDIDRRGLRPGPPSGASFEWAVRMAASSAAHLVERGYAVDLATSTAQASQPPLADAPGISAALAPVLGELALLRVNSADGAPPPREAHPSVPLIAIASVPQAATIDWMLAQRAPGTVAVLMLVTPPGMADAPDVVALADDFARAGWQVARVDASVPVDAAWRRLIDGPPVPLEATAILRGVTP